MKEQKLTSRQRYSIFIDEQYLLKLLRSQLFEAQGGRCYYCDSPMWEMEKELSRTVSAKPFMKLYNLKFPDARRFLCTTEHLIGRKDSGSNHIDNIAAACEYCNTKRFNVSPTITPEQYKRYVTLRMKWNIWFDFDVHNVFEYSFVPTYWELQCGKVIKFGINLKRKWKEFRKRNDFCFPSQMNRHQLIHSLIRTIDTRYIPW